MRHQRAPVVYVGGLAGLAAAATAGLLLLAPAAEPSLTAIAIAIVAIAVAERTEVDFRWDRTTGSFTLTEVATTALLLLQPAPHVVLAVLPAMALAHLPLWRTPVKVLYNVATPVLGTAVAALVLILGPDTGPQVADRPVLALVAGMLLHGAISVGVFAGLLACLQDRATAASLGRQLPLHISSTLGTTSVGVVTAALWVEQPELTPFVVALAASVHLAQRASVRAAALLAAQEFQHDRLVRVVDGASDGIVLLDADARVGVWNPAMERMTGILAQRATGRSAAALLSGEIRRGTPVGDRWHLADAHVGAPRREEEVVLVGPDGTVRDVLEDHTFTFDDRGRCTGAVVVVRDVSRQRELERLRSDFVARVSHELRTPLTPIRGFATVLLRRGDLLGEQERTEVLTRIVERADHLHHLVEDLLLVTRLEHDDLSGLVTVGPVAIEPTVRAAVDELRVGAPDRPVTLAIAEPVPTALADPDRLRKVLGVLLDNADRYTPAGTPVEVEVGAVGDDVTITVRDHGPGIPTAQREAVFERFHRLEDPLTMRTGGVGVGLFLARRLAHAMHGSLTLAESRRGDGCTFTVAIPRATPAPRAAGTSMGGPADVATSPSTERR